MRTRRGVQRIDSVDSEPVLGANLPSMEDDSLSLEQLGEVYAEMLAGSSGIRENQLSDEPFGGDIDAIRTGFTPQGVEELSHPVIQLESPDGESIPPSQDELAITPERIVEALLFVGQADGKPLSGRQIASTMRGVHHDEIPEFVKRLNQLYQSTGRVMRIVESSEGFMLHVATEMQRSANTIQGKLRETRLPPAAVDCLALVAYNPGATREDIERLWNRSASSTLNLLVRKDLLEVVREENESLHIKATGGKLSISRYHPTERFLNLLGLSSLHDLPRVDSDL